MMLDMLNTIDFHLLRPWWLIAILPALALACLLLKRRTDASGWAAVIDSELLTELLDGQPQTQKKWPLFALLLAWILAACAMAGPCFEKNNQAALKQADAVVILLDLSPSMLAQDVQPSRLQAAHYKILDLLHQRREGYTGLIAYSGSAHVVAPLSDDSNTIAALVSTLIPNIMPSIGSRVEDAVSEALQLLENSHFSRGRILLLTDGAVPEALANIQQQLTDKSVALNVIGIGTSAGAPISLPGGNFVKDNNGNILMNKLDEATLQKLAQENGGYYSPLRADDKDIAPLLAPPDWLTQLGNGDSRDASHTVENWQDAGYWLVLPCALLMLLFFRRGVLICLLPLLLLTQQENVRADNIPANNVPADNVQTDSPTALPQTWFPQTWFPQTWQDWWQTSNQQAAAALEKNDAATAAKQFTDLQWKAYAEYQNGQHKEAAEHFAASSSANAEYNRGNAQARAGDLQGALDSYEQSLQQKPDFTDAKFNRDLVKKLLDEQKKQQDQKNKDQNQQQDQQQDQQQQNQDKKDQQQQDQQNQDQQQNQQDKNQQQQQDQQHSNSKNEEQSDAQKSEEEKQSEAEKQAQTEKEQQDKDKQEKKASDSKQPDDKKDPEKKDTVSEAEGKSQADKEKQQANEQWLRKVPDDPGGLLKNKFEYYYQLNRQQAARERRAGSSNQEEQRW